MNIIKWVISIIFAFSPILLPAHAAGLAVNDAYVTSIVMDNGAYIYTDKALLNPDGCGASNTAIIASDIAHFQSYLSVIMTAFATNKNVSIYVSGCAPSPWGPTVPNIYAIILNR